MSRMDFVAMPVDAMFDPRLSFAHVRVLAVIAFHDRRGANGRGCFATISTMAKETGYDTRTVKRALSDLRTWKFLRSEQSRVDGRRLVHRIIYRSELEDNGDTHAPKTAENRGHVTQESGTLPAGETPQDQWVATPKQRQKQIKGEADPENRHHSLRSGVVEERSAGRRMHCPNDGAWLRKLQEELAKPTTDNGRLVEIYDDLEDLIGETDHGDGLNGWAIGLQEKAAAALDDLGYFNVYEGPTRDAA